MSTCMLFTVLLRYWLPAASLFLKLVKGYELVWCNAVTASLFIQQLHASPDAH